MSTVKLTFINPCGCQDAEVTKAYQGGTKTKTVFDYKKCAKHEAEDKARFAKTFPDVKQKLLEHHQQAIATAKQELGELETMLREADTPIERNEIQKLVTSARQELSRLQNEKL